MLLAGAICGGFWVLAVSLVLSAMAPGPLPIPLLAAVWIVTGFAMSIALSRPGSPRTTWGRAVTAIGLHALALPLAAAVAFVVGGARGSPPAAGHAELSATVLGVRMAASPMAIRAAVVGFVVGLVLLAMGDRALRRRRGSAP